MSKKKIIIIIAICVIVAIIIAGIIYALCSQKSDYEKIENIEVSQDDLKTVKLYDDLKSKIETGYTISIKVDNDNKNTIVVKGNNAYQEETYKGKTTKYVVKDGNTYLLLDETKEYYSYGNNTAIITKITDSLDSIISNDYTVGTEKISNKSYDYENYENSSNFLINYNILDDNEIGNTKLYFKNDELKYIKTIGTRGEELAKVSITNKADESLFEISSEYKNGDM